MGVMADRFDDGFRLVLAVAEALRNEFGVEIDAHPGGAKTEAGSVNRAFCAVVRTFVAESGDDPATFVTQLLQQAALRRLTDLGVQLQYAETLIRSESMLGNHWLAYLALAPASVIDELLGDGKQRA
jgi:hypothetical protein